MSTFHTSSQASSLERLTFLTNLWIDDYFSRIVNEIDYESETKLILLKAHILKGDVKNFEKQEEIYDLLSNTLNHERSSLLRFCKSLELDFYARFHSVLRSNRKEADLVVKWGFQASVNRSIIYLSAAVGHDGGLDEATNNLARLGKFVIISGIHLNDEQVELFKQCLLVSQAHSPPPSIETLNKATLFLRYFHRELHNNGENKSSYTLLFDDTIKKSIYISVEDVISPKTTELSLFRNRIVTLEPFTFDLQRACNDHDHDHGDGLAVSVYANLKLLDLSYNKIKLVPTHAFSSLVNLQQINLSHNEIDWIDAGAWSSLANLRRLFLHNNRLAKLDSRGVFQHLTGLNELNLANNQIETIESAQAFDGLEHLAFLSLKSNRLGKHLSMQVFEKLVELGDLDLSHNQIESIDFRLSSSSNPDHCRGPPGLNNLIHLNLSYNKLAKMNQATATATADTTTGYNSLLKLNLSCNRLSSPVQLESFAFMFKSLKWLNLAKNDLLEPNRTLTIGQEHREADRSSDSDFLQIMIAKHLSYIEYLII